MGTSVARGLSLTVVLVMMVVIVVIVVIVPSPINQRRGSAGASARAEILLKKSNASTTSPDFICDSLNKEECLIGDQDLEMEFQMESETSGRILSKLRSPALQSLIAQGAPLCQRLLHAKSCIGKPYRDRLKKETCSPYKRTCHT